MKIFVIVLLLTFAIPAFSQDVVADAAKQIEKEKYDARVARAKALLQEKAQLEKRLKEIGNELLDVESWKDEQPSRTPQLRFVDGSNSTTGVTYSTSGQLISR